ncbi:MAG: hypothetical protein L0220_02215 [Acidobacteria bacterium]|nr:hypothetical protein [Acidobacteriota bacterium]
MNQFLVALLLVAISAFSSAVKADEYKLEPIGAMADTKVPDTLRNALENKGIRVLDDEGNGFCELWLSKSIPTKKTEVSGANFAQIPEGSFIGIINFLSDRSDYRGQGIKPGFYTLRYGLILQDGNHQGVSPARDFFLACPITEDKNPSVQLKTEDLYKFSRIVTGTGHPSVWCLVLVSERKGLPKVVKNDSEQVVLELNIPSGSTGPTIGMVIFGRAEG